MEHLLLLTLMVILNMEIFFQKILQNLKIININGYNLFQEVTQRCSPQYFMSGL